jgi:putative ABC transport system permease protein
VNFGVLAARNLTRNKLRVGLTVGGVAIAVVAFLLLRTVVWAWNAAAEASAKDRLATRHKISIILNLPKRYADDIRAIPGVKVATWMTWFGAKDPKDEQNFFANMAVDEKTFLDVYTDADVPKDQVEAWKADPQGALIGSMLAKKMGLKLGDKVTLAGTIYPGDWTFNVRAIYTATSKAIDSSQFFFHWDYLNNSLRETRRDQIGWVMSRIDDPSKGGDITAAIDKLFDDRDIQTMTQSEKALNNSFLAMFAAILTALDISSFVILLIMTLLLGNTIAMGVRERTFEYGVMRAIGFLPGHVLTAILLEAVFVGLLGGLVGLAIAYPVVQEGLGRFLEENMGGFFPYFRIQSLTALLAVVLAMGLGTISALLPAWRASKLSVTDALRRIG